MNWLTKIPTSTLDVDRKRLAEKKQIEAKSKTKTEVIEEKAKKPEPLKSSYNQIQSPLGQAADIAVFGIPMGIFR
jgi:hypothetical protein